MENSARIQGQKTKAKQYQVWSFCSDEERFFGPYTKLLEVLMKAKSNQLSRLSTKIKSYLLLHVNL